MVRIPKVRVTFPKSTMDLVGFTRSVLLCVKTNPKFPNLNDPPPAEPDPTIPTWTQVKAGADALEVQQIKLYTVKSKAETSLRDDLQRVLDAPVEGLLVKWANYVQEKSGTNITDMLSSGFRVTDQPNRIDSLPQPEFLRIISSSKGSLTFGVNVVEKAKGYGWILQKVNAEDQPVAGVPPIQKFSSPAESKFTGLESGARYACTAYAMGSRYTVSTESDPLTVVCP